MGVILQRSVVVFLIVDLTEVGADANNDHDHVMLLQLLQDASSFVDHLGNWELVMWCLTLSIFLMRFVTLGTSINKKYRNFSVLITEQVTLTYCTTAAQRRLVASFTKATNQHALSSPRLLKTEPYNGNLHLNYDFVYSLSHSLSLVFCYAAGF